MPWAHALRLRVASLAARGASVGARVVGHSATSIPGLVATALAPDAVRSRASALDPIILVVGTNGKTTTARLLSRIVAVAATPPVTNASGANLYQSIASTLVLDRGASDRGGRRPGIFEVDELALPAVVRDLHPTAIVATNLFRDQLDRYGEVAVIVDRWRDALRAADAATFVYCGDDPRLAMLAADSGRRTLSFGLDPAGMPPPGGATATPSRRDDRAPTAPDPVSCDRCGRPLVVDGRTIGHLGRFRCSEGHLRWRPADLTFMTADAGFGSDVCVTLGGERRSFRFVLGGLSFGDDAAAAIATAAALGIPVATATRALEDVTAAFGRSERLEIGGRTVVLALTKNPASLGEASRLAERLRPAVVLLALNDAFADGRDVSWIWDAEVGPLVRSRSVIVSGSRTEDLALRLKYDAAAADGRLSAQPVHGLPDALARSLAAAAPGETVLVVATYTALLALRAELVRLGHAAVAPV
ncbi:MAG TPA: MurT ligase domain-containing protein [Candidatus Limnocylindrales bacterium]|nr:MurT ligase domain-containing protein [Candidatus Limnocylindrales bacterium]